jgi:hypothetical protein
VAALRPIIYSRPVTRARAGQEYVGEVRALRSLGDVRMRMIDGKETLNYWDAEQPRFRLEQAPAWLRIDEWSGQLSGVPDRAGRFEVTVAATLERELRSLDPGQLQWGIEKVIETRLETVGTAKQSFVIEAAP